MPKTSQHKINIKSDEVSTDMDFTQHKMENEDTHLLPLIGQTQWWVMKYQQTRTSLDTRWRVRTFTYSLWLNKRSDEWWSVNRHGLHSTRDGGWEHSLTPSPVFPPTRMKNNTLTFLSNKDEKQHINISLQQGRDAQPECWAGQHAFLPNRQQERRYSTRMLSLVTT